MIEGRVGLAGVAKEGAPGSQARGYLALDFADVWPEVRARSHQAGQVDTRDSAHPRVRDLLASALGSNPRDVNVRIVIAARTSDQDFEGRGHYLDATLRPTPGTPALCNERTAIGFSAVPRGTPPNSPNMNGGT